MTSSSPADAGTNAVGVQETTTAAEAEETTREADEPAQQDQASVTFDEQESDGEQVVIESATLPEGGFIAIHDSSYQDAPLASVLGNSVYLEPGTHENVEITLARPVAETQTLVAMPHLDTNENQVYDFVLSTGAVDGPYTVDNETVVDEANVTVAQETTTTTEAAEETTTTEEAEETTTEAVEETTTTEEDEVEETTTEAVEETTTTEEADGVEETTTEVEDAEEMRQLVFKVEQMNIDRWSFVIGDEETPDRTETVGNLTIQDRRVVLNLSEILRQSEAAQQQAPPVTTQSPEQVEQMLEQNLSQDIQTVRYVIQNVQIENVTFVVTAPEDVELPEPPMMTTTPAEPGEETTTEEEEVEETTTEVVEVTTTEEEEVEETTTEVVEETTTEEEEVEETTTEEVVEETTTEEEEVEETTTEAAEETTTEAADLQSFEVSNLDAPGEAAAGDTIEVSATVSNPNDQQATQAVVFRLEGTVIASQTVTLDAGEQTTVTFEIDTEGVPGGQYIHGVYTRDFGELAVIVIEEPSAETTTAVETETPEETATPEETETPVDAETTVETTTEA